MHIVLVVISFFLSKISAKEAYLDFFLIKGKKNEKKKKLLEFKILLLWVCRRGVFSDEKTLKCSKSSVSQEMQMPGLSCLIKLKDCKSFCVSEMHQSSVKQHFVPIFAEIPGQRPGQVAPVLSPSS